MLYLAGFEACSELLRNALSVSLPRLYLRRAGVFEGNRRSSSSYRLSGAGGDIFNVCHVKLEHACDIFTHGSVSGMERKERESSVCSLFLCKEGARVVPAGHGNAVYQNAGRVTGPTTVCKHDVRNRNNS